MGLWHSPAFPWGGFCNRLASGLQSSLLWSPASQNPLPCKHQQYEAYSWECFFTNISNTRVFRFEITPEDSSTKSWERHTTNASSPSPFISPSGGRKLEKKVGKLNEEATGVNSWLTLTPCGQLADEDEARGGMSPCHGLPCGLRHAVVFAAQACAHLQAWVQLSAIRTKAEWWGQVCAHSISLISLSRYFLDMYVDPKDLHSEPSFESAAWAWLF